MAKYKPKVKSVDESQGVVFIEFAKDGKTSITRSYSYDAMGKDEFLAIVKADAKQINKTEILVDQLKAMIDQEIPDDEN